MTDHAYSAGFAMGHTHALALADGETDIDAMERERDRAGDLWRQGSLREAGLFDAGYEAGFTADQA